MKRSRSLSDDERVLWSAVTRTLAPLKGRRAAKQAADVAAIEARPNAQRAPVAPPKGVQRSAQPALAPIDRRTKQRLARGVTEIDGRLDLHGLTLAAAHATLARFLHGAQVRGAKVVLVITGKGGAEGRGALKRQVPLWLEGLELRALVVGFDSAGAGHGGEGALYVRVRRGRA